MVAGLGLSGRTLGRVYDPGYKAAGYGGIPYAGLPPRFGQRRRGRPPSASPGQAAYNQEFQDALAQLQAAGPEKAAALMQLRNQERAMRIQGNLQSRQLAIQERAQRAQERYYPAMLEAQITGEGREGRRRAGEMTEYQSEQLAAKKRAAAGVVKSGGFFDNMGAWHTFKNRQEMAGYIAAKYELDIDDIADLLAGWKFGVGEGEGGVTDGGAPGKPERPMTMGPTGTEQERPATEEEAEAATAWWGRPTREEGEVPVSGWDVQPGNVQRLPNDRVGLTVEVTPGQVKSVTIPYKAEGMNQVTFDELKNLGGYGEDPQQAWNAFRRARVGMQRRGIQLPVVEAALMLLYGPDPGTWQQQYLRQGPSPWEATKASIFGPVSYLQERLRRRRQ